MRCSLPTRFCPGTKNARARPMLDRTYLRENTDEVRDALENRGADVDIDEFLELDERWRELKARGDDLRHERNQITKKIGKLVAEGKEEEREKAIKRSRELKAEIEEVEEEGVELEDELRERILEIPQIPDESVPLGLDERHNVEDRRWGFDDLRELPDEVTPHYDVGEDLDIIDEARGAKTTGSGFYFLKGEGAMLEHALVQFMLDVHREQDYVDVFPPIPVKSTAMRGTGQLPKFADDAYRLGGAETVEYDDDDL